MKLPSMNTLLFRLSGRLKCKIIRRDGPYLERYHLVTVPDWMPVIGGMQAHLHRFLNSDSDKELHDHPWPWAVSVILSGSYTEERMAGFDRETGIRIEERRRRPGTAALLSGKDFHRVTLPEDTDGRPRPVWTLFIHQSKIKEWGFIEPLSVGGRWTTFGWRCVSDGGEGTTWRDTPRGKDRAGRVGL